MIFVDSREAAALGSAKLSQLGTYEVKQLPYGDYVVQVGDKSAIFERKRVTEFIGCINSRVFEQLQGMKTFPGEAYLIVEGSPGIFMKKSFRRFGYVGTHQFIGFILSVQRKFQVGVVPTGNVVQSLAVVEAFERRIFPTEAKGKPKQVFANFVRLGKTPQKIALSALACMVGAGMADKLLKRFGTLAHFFHMLEGEPEAILEIEGVGEKTMGKLRRIAGANYNEVSKDG